MGYRNRKLKGTDRVMKDYFAEQYDEVIEAVYNGILIVNRQGYIVMCNTSGCHLLGKEKHEVIDKHITEIVEDSMLMKVLLDEKARLNRPSTIRSKTVIGNSSPIYKNQELIGAIAVFQDITELKEAVSQLDEKEKEVNKLKEMLELLYDGIVMVDREGIITMINQRYCDFLEIKMEDAVGKYVNDVIKNSRMHTVIKTGQPETGSVMEVNNKKIMVMRTPIKKNDEVVGAIGKVMFTDLDDLKTLASRLNVLETRLDFYKKELKKARGAKYSFKQIIGESLKIIEAKELALKVAPSRSTILIRGESGTGKELFAHAIHEASNRAEGPLIRLNCAAIPANILEAELFGYEEGAFTGARKGGKPGKIEQAQGGTLFLDEIGDMPLDMQVKLLRVLQEKEVERIGGTQVSQVDIRVIAATNQNLEEMVKKGEFREDLYYRLNVIHIQIPPLRERGRDIITTALFLLDKLNKELGTNITSFEPAVEQLLMQYHWPGNVRELQNIIERAIHMAINESIITLDHLPPYLIDVWEDELVPATYSLAKEIEKSEQAAIKRVLKYCQGNRSKAAELLGIHRASLYRKMEKYNLLDLHS